MSFTEKKAEDSKKFNARITNGNSKERESLEGIRKRIINELNEKDNSKKKNANHFNDRFNNHFRTSSPHKNKDFRHNNSSCSNSKNSTLNQFRREK